MSLVYILVEGEEQRIVEENEIPGLVAQGDFPAGTLYWKEGMDDWRPLSELAPQPGPAFVPRRRTGNQADTFRTFEANAQRMPATADESSQSTRSNKPARERRRYNRFQLRSNIVPLTICLQVVQVAAILGMGYIVYECLDNLYGWSNGIIPPPVGVPKENVKALLPVFFVAAGLYLLADILFMYWIYFATKNTRGFSTNTKYSPGWAVGYFFIPFLNLVMPYLVMQEMWKVSENPISWIGRRDSIFIGFWFACRLAITILARGPFHTSYSESSNPDIQEIDLVLYIILLEGIFFAIQSTTMILVSVVTWRQVRISRTRGA